MSIQNTSAYQPSTTARLFQAIGAIVGWLTLALQFYIIIDERVVSVPETILRYFGFFTIENNLLVALYFTVLLLFPRSSPGRFFARDTIATAIAVYIALVGITYQVLLRHTWNPQGLQRVADESLHSVMPVYFVLYWLLFVAKKASLQWKHMLSWMIFPLCYLAYTLVRGAITVYYPYPFLDVSNLGYGPVFINSGFILIAFVVLASLFIGIAKMRKS